MRYLFKIAAELYMISYRYKLPSLDVDRLLLKRVTLKPSSSFTYPFF